MLSTANAYVIVFIVVTFYRTLAIVFLACVLSLDEVISKLSGSKDHLQIPKLVRKSVEKICRFVYGIRNVFLNMILVRTNKVHPHSSIKNCLVSGVVLYLYH